MRGDEGGKDCRFSFSGVKRSGNWLLVIVERAMKCIAAVLFPQFLFEDGVVRFSFDVMWGEATMIGDGALLDLTPGIAVPFSLRRVG